MKLSGSWKPSPDGQWRLLFALSRFGGLRCPSEHLALRWSDVDWERGRMTVQSPKTEYHPGGESQIIPIFPELRPHLEAAWEMAEPGTVHVITRYRDANANLRTQLLRIIRRAGLKPWPKLFANLRSTGDGVGRIVSDSRCLRVDWQFPGGGRKALPPSH